MTPCNSARPSGGDLFISASDTTPGALRRWLRAFLPEPAREAYRRLRDRVQRARYDPQRFWTRFGRTYIRKFPPGGERGEKLIIGTIRELEARSVLDIGCGYGRYLRAIAAEMRLDRLAGADISPTQIEEARKYCKDFPQIELAVSPATRLPFADAGFDLALTYGLMIHLRPREVEQFLAEARRVCRRWGVFLESSNNPERPHLNPPYYFAHEYDRVFAKMGMPVVKRIQVHEQTREYLYVVKLAPQPEYAPRSMSL